MNIIHGEFLFASAKRSLTRLAPTPTNISTKSEPEIEKNGTSASPATAFAKRVLPVPGGPTSRTPFGILAPISAYFVGSLRKSTISVNSSFSSVIPATSLNVKPVSISFFARLLPKFIYLFPPFDAATLAAFCPMMINKTIKARNRANIYGANFWKSDGFSTSSSLTFILFPTISLIDLYVSFTSDV